MRLYGFGVRKLIISYLRYISAEWNDRGGYNKESATVELCNWRIPTKIDSATADASCTPRG